MALEGGEGSASRPGRSLPPGKTRYPLYRRLGGPQGHSGQVRKSSPTPGFEPRTVHPLTSRYTDYANRPTSIQGHYRIFSLVTTSLSSQYICIFINEILKTATDIMCTVIHLHVIKTIWVDLNLTYKLSRCLCPSFDQGLGHWYS
jgi:hypothetical protein